MTPSDARLLFTEGELKLPDKTVYFDGKQHFNFVKDETPHEGTYEFISHHGDTYLRTSIPIHADKLELLVTLCLENIPVKLKSKF